MLGLLERVEQGDLGAGGKSPRGCSGASMCLPEGMVRWKG